MNALEEALKCGIREKNFWQMDLNELRREMKAAIERRKEETKEKAMFTYKLAELINIGTARCLGGKMDWPNIEDVFPSLFNTEKIQEQRELDKAIAWGEKFKAYAAQWNERIKHDND